MSHVRLLPSETNTEDVRQLRKIVAAAAILTENTSTQIIGCFSCEKKAYTGCPFTAKDIGKMPRGGTTFTMRESMETQACYIPMVKDNYTCHKIHVLAIKGTARESDLMDLLQTEPDSAHFKDSAGNTPLMLACVARNVSNTVSEALLKRSSKEYVNVENEDGLTALHFAVLNNQPELVELLITHGADINAGRVKVGGQHYGLTPLLMTVICNRTDENRCLDVLLQYNPDMDVQTVEEIYRDINSLYFYLECDCGGCKSRAPAYGNLLPPSKIKTVAWVAQGPAVYHATLNDLSTSLSTLLDNYEAATRHYVLFHMETCEESLNLLGVAIRNMRIKTMKVLIEKESLLVNKKEGYFQGHLNVAPLHLVLLRTRCFENAYVCGFCGETMTYNGNIVMKVLDPLLDTPVIDVNARIGNRLQHTPLMMAVDNGHEYAIEKLLNRGADPMAVDANGCTAVDLALKHGHDLCLKILKVLFKTGLSHEIYGQPFVNSLTLKIVSDKKDIDIFKLFRLAGAISESNRVAMYNKVLTSPEAVEQDASEEENKEQFLMVLQMATPLPLKLSTQMYFSARTGIESPQNRPEAVKETLRKFMDKNDTSNQTEDQVVKVNEHVEQKDKAKRKANKEKTSPKPKRQKTDTVSKNTNCGLDENLIEGSCSSDDEKGLLERLYKMMTDLLDFNLRPVGV